MGTTERIARFIVETRYSDMPADAIRLAKEAIMDGLGVMLAGALEPAGKMVAEFVREEGGAPQAGVFGQAFKAPVAQAALANGTMAHALDYDDVISIMSGHPTVPVLPAVLALAESQGRSGADVIEAYVIGVEVEARIGSGMGRRHYAVGWHPTATLGSLGAASASARLLRLNVDQTRMALGLAASEASGLRQNFGTMTKPFHAGHAARAGVVAATLARKGFTADPDILESPYGFLPVLAGENEYDLERMTENLGSPFAVVDPGLDMKPYPCCRFIHRCIDAMLHIVGEHHPAAADVAEIECHTGRLTPRIVIHHRPRTPLEGKFSMEYCMARALLDGEMRMAQFSEAKVLAPRAQELLRRVRYVHPEDAGEVLPAESVTVTLRDGRQYSHQVAIAKGSPQNPLSAEELRAKYRDCASLVLPAEAVDRSLEMVSHLEDISDIAELARLLTSSPTRVAAGPGR